MASALNGYSALDRLVHRLAFATPAVQLAAVDIENAVFGSVFSKASADEPIFITSLPRAGTTILLTALSRLPMLATHLYRDMPFVMAPILWARLSGKFRREERLRERAHGDGMQIGYDSPEAFEEIIWQTFWPNKYAPDGIALWDAQDADNEGIDFLRTHIKKIVALRRPDRLADGRYLSKNNANLARIDLLKTVFPGARFIVPVRRPLEHAVSLLRQHTNFIGIHRKDSFARRYMSDIGHFEFGALHRPIRFPGLTALLNGLKPTTLDYWLAYWISAFEYVSSHRDSVTALSYEAFCDNAADSARDLCRRLAIDAGDGIAGVGGAFRPPTPFRQPDTPYSPSLLYRANDVYSSLNL